MAYQFTVTVEVPAEIQTDEVFVEWLEGIMGTDDYTALEEWVCNYRDGLLGYERTISEGLVTTVRQFETEEEADDHLVTMKTLLAPDLAGAVVTYSDVTTV